MRPRRQYNYWDQEENIKTADQLNELELFHVAYDYYEFVVDWYKGYQAANDYSNHQARLFSEQEAILYCKTQMLVCQFKIAAVPLTVLESNIIALREALDAAVTRPGADKKRLKACGADLQAILTSFIPSDSRIAYICSAATLLNNKIHTEAFSEYAHCMEIDVNNFMQKFQRMLSSIQELKVNEVVTDVIAKLNEAIADLCVVQAATPEIELQTKKALLEEAKNKYNDAILSWHALGLSAHELLPLSYLNTLQELYKLSVEAQEAKLKIAYQISIHCFLSSGVIENMLVLRPDSAEKQQLQSEISSYHAWYTGVMSQVTTDNKEFIAFLRDHCKRVLPSPQPWQQIVDGLLMQPPPPKRRRLLLDIVAASDMAVQPILDEKKANHQVLLPRYNSAC